MRTDQKKLLRFVDAANTGKGCRGGAVVNDQNAVAGGTVHRNVRLFKHICVDPTLDCLRNSVGCLIQGLSMGTWSVQPLI